MRDQIDNLRSSFRDEMNDVKTTKELDQLKVKYLGKKGPIQSLMALLKDASAEQRPLLGKDINELKESITSEIDQKFEQLGSEEESKQLQLEKEDITLPGRKKLPWKNSSNHSDG